MYQILHIHDWGRDGIIHDLVSKFKSILDDFGWNSWIGEGCNVDHAISLGGDNIKVTLIHITRDFLNEIERDVDSPFISSAACRYDWHAVKNLKDKLFVPVIHEADLVDPNNWPSDEVRRKMRRCR